MQQFQILKLGAPNWWVLKLFFYPKSVRNRYVIELFGGVFVLSLYLFDSSSGIGAFVIGLSQISFFFSSLEKISNTINENIYCGL